MACWFLDQIDENLKLTLQEDLTSMAPGLIIQVGHNLDWFGNSFYSVPFHWVTFISAFCFLHGLYIKGVILCDFKSSFLFGVLQADHA